MTYTPVESCPLCGGAIFTPYRPAYSRPLSHEQIASGAPFAFVTNYATCIACGLIFQTPRPGADAVAAEYGSGDYRIGCDPEVDDPREMERQRRVVEFVPPFCRFLDVGSSRGYLLELAHDRGCDVVGVEPNAAYSQTSLPVVRDIAQAEGEFDCVACLHVLEHVYDPAEFARLLSARVKPGGMLLLEVPSERTGGGGIGSAHLYLFQPWVIRQMLCEFEILQYQVVPHSFFVLRKRWVE